MRDLFSSVFDLIEPLGGPGLALIAFLDSSFLSLPEVNDVLIVVLVLQRPGLWLYYAALTTAGSVAGCFTLFSVARKGGEAFLRRRFSSDRLDRGLAVFRKYGLLAVVVPSILPPPTPFKVFVVLAGISGVRRSSFLIAVTIGRGFRYGSEALMTRLYGEQARVFIQDNLPIVSYVVAGLVLTLGVGFVVYQRVRRRRMGPHTP
jgi:membrane protein YqaA with SNARE-associated domain